MAEKVKEPIMVLICPECKNELVLKEAKGTIVFDAGIPCPWCCPKSVKMEWDVRIRSKK